MTAETDRRLAHGGVRARPADLRRIPIDTREPRETVDPRDGIAVFEPAPAHSLDLDVHAADLRTVFEEAATQLVRHAARPDTAGPAWRWESVYLRAIDASHLAGLWLDRVVSLGQSRLADERREAVVIVAVDTVSEPDADPQFGRWQLRARVGLRPYRETPGAAAPPLSPLDQPISVAPSAGGWVLQANLRG